MFYLVEAGVFLGHPPHADGAPDAGQPGVVGGEEGPWLQGCPPSTPRVVLPVAADDGLVAPGLEELAPLVPETFLTRHQHAEVHRHLGRNRRLDLSVLKEVEIRLFPEARIYKFQRY